MYRSSRDNEGLTDVSDDERDKVKAVDDKEDVDRPGGSDGEEAHVTDEVEELDHRPEEGEDLDQTLDSWSVSR